jgi:thiol-disulfide isomerase/thioredoxin
MKKIGFFFMAIAIVSCKTEVNVDYAILSGKIKNTTSKKVTLYNMYDTSIKKEITLKEGQFTDTVKISNGNAFFLRQDQNSINLFLNQGDLLDFTYDAKKPDSTLVFLGVNSIVSTYLHKKSTMLKEVSIGTKELYSKNEEAFKTRISGLKKVQQDFLYNTNELPKTFTKNETSNINFNYLNSLSNYERYHQYYAKEKDFKASDKILNPLKGLTFNSEEDFQFSPHFRDLASNHFREKAQNLVKTDSLEFDLAYLKILAPIKSDRIRNKLLFDDAQYGITYTDNLEAYYALYSKNSTNKENNIKITASYKKLQALAEGNPSSKFMDYENNAGGTTSLEDLKGKYVYMDIWATWCGPCIAEIPYLKQTEKQYHNKNIEFVSISIDRIKDHKKWKKMIVDKELGGLQLFADNNWDSKFIQDYLIKGIPRFILLDPKGNIVSANAPRPSDKKLIALFTELKI